MNRHYSLTLTCEATYQGKTVTFEFDPYDDGIKDDDDLNDLAKDKLEDEHEWEDEIILADISTEITDWGDTPSGHDSDIESVYTFATAWAECEQEMDVVVAALEAGVEADDIDEAYCGQFDNDEAFAEDMADNIGAIDRDAKWPTNCIDWEQAARELMHDYSEQNGYYFRAM